MRHASAVNSADFSPDGNLIVTGCQGNAVQLWDAHTGRPISQPLRHARESVRWLLVQMENSG